MASTVRASSKDRLEQQHLHQCPQPPEHHHPDKQTAVLEEPYILVHDKKISAIRDLLKVTERPEVISFAGGVPTPLSFPIEHMRALGIETPHIKRDFIPE